MNSIHTKAANVTVLLTEGAAIAFPHRGWTVSRGGFRVRQQQAMRRRAALLIAHANDNAPRHDLPLRPGLQILPAAPASSPATGGLIPGQGEAP